MGSAGRVMRSVEYGIYSSARMGDGSSAKAWFPPVAGRLVIEDLEVELVIGLGHDLREEMKIWLSSR